MPIQSIVTPALQGIQRSLQGMRRVAASISNATPGNKTANPSDLSRALLEMKQHAHQSSAAVQVIKHADETLGTLLDEKA
ncbi:hypothetical protein [endosymbiont of Riftia pachyptila]|nr:hypothetical protein [endosymbiont of Riftia pachyptila]EGV50538.1 hypothetical protein Rifp1Sym_cw00060 [endosymbiont of Riftia pachyptila (vent Ph05)]